MNKIVKCINKGNNAYLTVGKEYEVLGMNDTGRNSDPVWYVIAGDMGDTMGYSALLFADVDASGIAMVASTMAIESVKPANGGWSNAHYNFDYVLTAADIKRGSVRVDAYFVSKQWRLGEKDHSGVLFHNLKTLTRFGDKNPREREIVALYAQVKRLAELEGVTLP